MILNDNQRSILRECLGLGGYSPRRRITESNYIVTQARTADLEDIEGLLIGGYVTCVRETYPSPTPGSSTEPPFCLRATSKGREEAGAPIAIPAWELEPGHVLMCQRGGRIVDLEVDETALYRIKVTIEGGRVLFIDRLTPEVEVYRG